MSGQRMAMPVGTERKDRGVRVSCSFLAVLTRRRSTRRSSSLHQLPYRSVATRNFCRSRAWTPGDGGLSTYICQWAGASHTDQSQAYKTLNRLQSIVFPVAYNTNENLLVCAPTGAVRLSLLRESC